MRQGGVDLTGIETTLPLFLSWPLLALSYMSTAASG